MENKVAYVNKQGILENLLIQCLKFLFVFF